MFAEADYSTKRIRSKAAVPVQVQLQGYEEGGFQGYDTMDDVKALKNTLLHQFIYSSIHLFIAFYILYGGKMLGNTLVVLLLSMPKASIIPLAGYKQALLV